MHALEPKDTKGPLPLLAYIPRRLHRSSHQAIFQTANSRRTGKEKPLLSLNVFSDEHGALSWFSTRNYTFHVSFSVAYSPPEYPQTIISSITNSHTSANIGYESRSTSCENSYQMVSPPSSSSSSSSPSFLFLNNAPRGNSYHLIVPRNQITQLCVLEYTKYSRVSNTKSQQPCLVKDQNDYITYELVCSALPDRNIYGNFNKAHIIYCNRRHGCALLIYRTLTASTACLAGYEGARIARAHRLFIKLHNYRREKLQFLRNASYQGRNECYPSSGAQTK